eukprot:8751593-Ditylum_brightwellii.AAC.1
MDRSARMQAKRQAARSLRNLAGGAAETFPERMQTEIPLELAAGSVVVMDDTLVHCSRSNLSGCARRVYMPQFSLGPVRP